MTKIVVTGAGGRMGQRIIANLLHDPETQLVGAVEAPGSILLGKDAGGQVGSGSRGIKITDRLEEALGDGDVLIDFTLPTATASNLQVASLLKKGAVVGTTGHTPDQRKLIEKSAKDIPIVFASNMSVGVNVLWKVLGVAAPPLNPSSIISVTETHHVHKKDSPSGTALEIERILRQAVGDPARPIVMRSNREGEVVGDHTVVFDSPEETITLTHQAKTRDAFAVGAIRAAKWVNGKPAGLYTMQDVLGL